jgi:hypothetical protein
MKTKRQVIGSTVGVAAAVIASGGFFAVSAAHAEPNCLVQGPQLNIHHHAHFDVSVDANGAALGPGANVQPPAPAPSTHWNVTGGINGRNVDFILTFGGTKANVHFTGTVGPDGFAHGTSTEARTPVTLAAGNWDSTSRFTC